MLRGARRATRCPSSCSSCLWRTPCCPFSMREAIIASVLTLHVAHRGADCVPVHHTDRMEPARGYG
ncbi:unnamed protein product, partial [Arctogadus glacialis]